MQTVCDYFGVHGQSQLTWAHRVNHLAYLAECCADDTLMIAEGDVWVSEDDQNPFMANQTQDIANLDFATWAAKLNAANKAMKIDLQTPDALLPVLENLQELNPTVPVIVHAEVFRLLGQSDGPSLEPDAFIHAIRSHFPAAIISLGWALKRAHDADGRVEDMLIDQMCDMALKRLGDAAYDIEIRGGYTPGWDRGAALIFEPRTPAPRQQFSGNVVDGAALFRKKVA